MSKVSPAHAGDERPTSGDNRNLKQERPLAALGHPYELRLGYTTNPLSAPLTAIPAFPAPTYPAGGIALLRATGLLLALC